MKKMKCFEYDTHEPNAKKLFLGIFANFLQQFLYIYESQLITAIDAPVNSLH